MSESNHLRAYRQSAWLTQRALARKSRVCLRTIHSIEQGKPCRMDTKRKLLRALGVPFTDRHKVWPAQVSA